MSRPRRRRVDSGLPSGMAESRAAWIASRLRRTKVTLDAVLRIIQDLGDIDETPEDDVKARALREIRTQVKETLEQEKIDANR